MECRPLKSELPCEISFASSPEGRLRIEARLPNEDDRAILLHRLRPSVLEKEPASFAHVAAILGRRVSQPVVREILGLQNRLWDGRNFAAQGLIKVNGLKLNSDRLLNAWLNGEEYHRDTAKAMALGPLKQSEFFALFDWIIVNRLRDRLRAISNLAGLVALVLGKSPELHFCEHRLSQGDG